MAKRGEAWFEHLLARDLGMSVARLRRELTTEEWTRWVAFYQLEAEEKARQAKQQRGR